MQIERLILGPLSANSYIITEEKSGETAIIDCGEYTEELKERLKGISLKYILITHGHADHTLGVYDLKHDHPEAKIVIHRLDAICLVNEEYSGIDQILPGAQKFIEADMTVEEGDILTLGDLEIDVMHTPGHSKGSVCYKVESEHTIFSGDTLFCLTVGRTDIFCGDDDEMNASIRRFFDMEGEYIIYPGHNRDTTLSYEKRRNRYMRRFRCC